MGCYSKIYTNCKENHKQLEKRLFKDYTYNLEWLERFWMKEAFIVIAGPLETDPVDFSQNRSYFKKQNSYRRRSCNS